MKRKIGRGNVVSFLLLFIILILAVSLSFLRYKEVAGTWIEGKESNDIRLLVQDERKAIENGMSSGSYTEGRYPYLVYDTEGKVLYAGKPFIQKEGSIVNIQEMQQRDASSTKVYAGYRKESFIVMGEKQVTGFITFLIPEEQYQSEPKERQFLSFAWPLLFGTVLVIGIAAYRTWYLSRRILQPMNEISRSAKAITEGNYEVEVVRVFGEEIQESEMGELTYSFELMRDELKEKQLTEERLRQSQQELVSCISHDLRTPIATIKAYSEAIRDGIAKTEEARKSYMKVILDKTNLLNKMIAELLAVSNAQLNQLHLEYKEEYFKGYFERVMKELSYYVEAEQIAFTWEGLKEDMIVTMDEKRITEVLYNLAENSIKYIGRLEDSRTTDGGTGQIHIRAERRANLIAVTVTDNGIGISQMDIPYVFDKFYRAEKSRSSRIPGSGLGLSICKYIVEAHGGEICCRSRGQGKGAEFSFTIDTDMRRKERTKEGTENKQ